jgi:hypothetical protein
VLLAGGRIGTQRQDQVGVGGDVAQPIHVAAEGAAGHAAHAADPAVALAGDVDLARLVLAEAEVDPLFDVRHQVEHGHRHAAAEQDQFGEGGLPAEHELADGQVEDAAVDEIAEQIVALECRHRRAAIDEAAGDRDAFVVVFDAQEFQAFTGAIGLSVIILLYLSRGPLSKYLYRDE